MPSGCLPANTGSASGLWHAWRSQSFPGVSTGSVNATFLRRLSEKSVSHLSSQASSLMRWNTDLCFVYPMPLVRSKYSRASKP